MNPYGRGSAGMTARRMGHLGLCLWGLAWGWAPLGGQAADAPEPLRLGVSLPLSGNLASFGQSTLTGIKFAVEELNQAGGLGGHPVVLEIEDNKADQDQTITGYKKLENLKQVAAVIGPITSTNSLAILDDVTAAKCPTISPTATNDKVAPGSPYMFRACYCDSFQGQIVASYALTTLKLKTAAVMVDKGSDYSIGLTRSFKAAFTKGGGRIVAEESYKQGDTEYGAKLAPIKNAGAELVFVPGYPGEVPLILKQAGRMGLTAKFCGADGWDHPDIITQSGDKIVGSFLVGAFAVEDQRPEVQRFVKAMAARGQGDVGGFEALGYDSVSLLAAAAKAKGTTREQLREGLLSLKAVPCVTGAITMTPDGDAIKAAVVLGVDKVDGKYVKKYLATVNP